ncbi:MAG: hypothetical protein CVT92_11480 [Bacteroidetes bacterium HGW-Bacteroidetes-1]|jgi:hypothetical protein|nr:MAG: hypothetical protein CVT92_11480 [Bacteroidetes bacterium HGW-Bacteroidetes-1]
MGTLFHTYGIKTILILLRFATIVYIFAVLFPFIVDPGFQNTLGIWSVRWILILILGSISLVLFIITRSQFYIYGSFLVLVAAYFRSFFILTTENPMPELFFHFYVVAASIYLITHDLRVKSGGSRHQRKLKEQKNL